MRFSYLATLPLFVLSSALVIPSAESARESVAGSIVHSNSTRAAKETVGALEAEYAKLEILKQQLFDLHHEVVKQEHQIFLIINKDFHACSGFQCYVQTALKKAPDFFELLKTHFRHHPKNSTSAWDCPWSSSTIQADDPSAVADEEVISQTSQPSLATTEELSQTNNSHDSSPSITAAVEDTIAFDGYEGPPPPPPPPPEDGLFEGAPFDHPPPPPHHPEYQPWKPNPGHPASHPHDGHREHRPFRMPHPAPRHKNFKLILATFAFVLSVLILGILFKALRVYLSNPRVRAECAAIREERRTRREYRRAACQYRVRQCLNRFRPRRRSNSGTDDYEEKRATLQRLNSGDASGHVVGADINSLRRAHEIVGQLMRAEEGRMQDSAPVPSRSVQPREPVMNSGRSVRSMNTISTLPPYAPPPPRYSQELSRDMEVVDGFRYTPTQSDVTVTSSASSFILNDDDNDSCPDSSVVDCRSRMSMDTESVPPTHTRETSRNRKSLELAGDRFRGQFD